MIHKILSYAAIAIVAIIVFKIALGLLGLLVGVAVSVLVLATLGYVCYLMLRVFSPATAARVRELIIGRAQSIP